MKLVNVYSSGDRSLTIITIITIIIIDLYGAVRS